MFYYSHNLRSSHCVLCTVSHLTSHGGRMFARLVSCHQCGRTHLMTLLSIPSCESQPRYSRFLGSLVHRVSDGALCCNCKGHIVTISLFDENTTRKHEKRAASDTTATRGGRKTPKPRTNVNSPVSRHPGHCAFREGERELRSASSSHAHHMPRSRTARPGQPPDSVAPLLPVRGLSCGGVKLPRQPV